MPKVSVIISTWNRSKFILPTLQSAVEQTLTDREIIVVGDGCTDDTEDYVRGFEAQGVRWINLKHNTGSQAFANNVGIATARGEYLAFLGHDDIWAPHHLSDLVNALEKVPIASVAVAGAIFYGPEDSGEDCLTGLFANSDDASVHNFPPSSMMYRRDVPLRIGLWRAPWRCRSHVDEDFQLRSVSAGFTFRSTGRVSVHKFDSSSKYLDYLQPSSKAQETTLAHFRNSDGSWISKMVAKIKANNRAMIIRIEDHSQHEPGQLWRKNRAARGIQRPIETTVSAPTIIEQGDDPRGHDWHECDKAKGVRWAGPNPRPRILLPFTSNGPVTIEIVIHHIAQGTLDKFSVRLNGQPIPLRLQRLDKNAFIASLQAHLKTAGPSVLELHAPADKKAGPLRSLAVGRIRLTPAP
jgi:glycosyltransferase involved in cell wall biosynthesis